MKNKNEAMIIVFFFLIVTICSYMKIISTGSLTFFAISISSFLISLSRMLSCNFSNINNLKYISIFNSISNFLFITALVLFLLSIIIDENLLYNKFPSVYSVINSYNSLTITYLSFTLTFLSIYFDDDEKIRNEEQKIKITREIRDEIMKKRNEDNNGQ